MWPFAAVDIAAIVPTLIGICGLGGIVFTGLRYRRDDTTAVINQHSTILNDMKTLNGELRTTAVSLKEERDACRNEVRSLRGELQVASKNLSGQMTELHDKLDDGGDRT